MRVSEYATPGTLPCRLAVTIETRVTTAMDRAFVAVAEGLWVSVTLTVKLLVPVAVGVPLMTPEDELSDNPEGRLPEARDQL